MSLTIRRSEYDDAKHFVTIKEMLVFNNEKESRNGGFLLGSDEKTYREYISYQYCLTAEIDNKIVGFGIIKDKKSKIKSIRCFFIFSSG